MPTLFDESELGWAYAILGVSFLVEAITLKKALMTAQENALKQQVTVWKHIKSGKDPQTNVVLLEDSVAVIGCAIAAGCMHLTTVMQNPFWDATGSVMIGLCLAKVAQFIVSSNARYLLGQSIEPEKVFQITDELENRSTIRAIYDVKGTKSFLSFTDY